MNATRDSAPDSVFLTRKRVESFIVECLEKAGLPSSHARTEAAVLLDADYRGKRTHGLEILDRLLENVKAGTIVPSEPEILQEGPCTAWVDGRGAPASRVGEFSMDKAIQMASQNGIGWVSARGSNYIGSLGWYSMKACQRGMIGLCMCNTGPGSVPPGSKQKALGTNPICVAAPGQNGDYILFDSAMTTVSARQFKQRIRSGNEEIPESWGVGADGLPSTSASDISKGGLLPLGGFGSITGGHKGYGLILLVEVLTSVLGGAALGIDTLKGKVNGVYISEDLSQSFIAINPSHFGEGFSARLQYLLDTCRNCEPIDEANPVSIPGDRSRQHQQKVDKEGGLWYRKDLVETLNSRMRSLGGGVFLEDEQGTKT